MSFAFQVLKRWSWQLVLECERICVARLQSITMIRLPDDFFLPNSLLCFLSRCGRNWGTPWLLGRSSSAALAMGQWKQASSDSLGGHKNRACLRPTNPFWQQETKSFSFQRAIHKVLKKSCCGMWSSSALLLWLFLTAWQIKLSTQSLGRAGKPSVVHKLRERGYESVWNYSERKGLVSLAAVC